MSPGAVHFPTTLDHRVEAPAIATSLLPPVLQQRPGINPDTSK